MTSGKYVAPSELRLVALDQGMKVVETIHPSTSSFQFSPLVPKKLPYLIQAVFSKENYSKLIPPNPSLWRKKQVIHVYESGAEQKDIQITPAMWVTKKRGFLFIEKIFALNNRSIPPKSFSMKDFRIFIPPNAKDIRSGLTYQSSKMNIPISLSFIEKQKAYGIKRFLRPGQSTLHIRYSLPSYSFQDQPSLLGVQESKNHSFYVVAWRPNHPKGIVPKIKGADYKKINISGIGHSYQVDYSGNSPIRYDFSQLGFFSENPLESDFNPVFDTPEKALVTILFLVLALFSLNSFLLRFCFREESIS